MAAGWPVAIASSRRSAWRRGATAMDRLESPQLIKLAGMQTVAEEFDQEALFVASGKPAEGHDPCASREHGQHMWRETGGDQSERDTDKPDDHEPRHQRLHPDAAMNPGATSLLRELRPQSRLKGIAIADFLFQPERFVADAADHRCVGA